MTATILTVDDDLVVRALLYNLLYQEPQLLLVGEAENGEEGVHAAKELQPDVVLMDITMPRVNGFDATRRIKIENPKTKVIIVTVHAEAMYELAALKNGADAFIPKKRLSTDLLPAILRLTRSDSAEQTIGNH